MKKTHRLKMLTDNAINLFSGLLFVSFNDTQRTPLTGEEAEDKEDIIDYLNSNIDKQALQILQEFSDIKVTDNSIAVIDDIFEEGVDIRYLIPKAPQTKVPQFKVSKHKSSNKAVKNTALQNRQVGSNLKSNHESKTFFIPFRTQKGRPVERLYLLAAEAQIKQGIFDDIVAMILPSSEDKHDFTVTNTQFVSKNMIRIHVKSKTALVQDNPGYAYRFELNRASLNRVDSSGLFNFNQQISDVAKIGKQLWQYIYPALEQSNKTVKMLKFTKQYGLLGALEVYKRLPDPQTKHKAQPIATTVEKRYYTLRQLKSNTNEFSGEVDIYIHDDTAGSIWAKSLQTGSKIKVDTHYQETITSMTVGQPLFICDETSMPTVAAMLERWRMQTVPIVISITNDKADFAYFDDMVLPKSLQDKLHIHHINTAEVGNIADAVIELIKTQNTKIDCAWGALGKKDFRPIKQYLRDEHGLKGKLNRVRAYWV